LKDVLDLITALKKCYYLTRCMFKWCGTCGQFCSTLWIFCI